MDKILNMKDAKNKALAKKKEIKEKKHERKESKEKEEKEEECE